MRAKYALLIHAVLGFSLLYSARADDIITFPDLPDWQLRPDIQKFTAENLYAYINGAAPLYHSYQFTELTVGEYENAADKTILIEMYRHIDPVNAFGIFSQEKPDEGVFLAIGIQAYLSPPMLNLCVDNYYIKIICDDLGVETNTTLQFVGRKIAEQSAGRYDLPHYFQFFPDSGRVPYSEQYHSKAFLGHEFLNSIFTVKYAYDDQEFTLFIYAGTSDFPGDSVLAAYQSFVGAKNTHKNNDLSTFADPYNQPVAIIKEKPFLVGITGNFNKSTLHKYLTKVRHLIREYKKN